MTRLSSLAWYGIFIGTNGSVLLGMVIFTIYTTPWFERIATDVRTDPKWYWALLNGILTVALIVAKPSMQIADWWSDVALMIEMKNSACDDANVYFYWSFAFLIFHQVVSAAFAYFDSKSK